MKGKKNREKQSKSECKKERQNSFPAALILEGKKKSPNNLAHVSEKMRAAKNEYDTP